MSPTVLEYIGFIIAALILIWAALELGRRLEFFRTFGRARSEKTDRWIKLDPSRIQDVQKLPLVIDEEEPQDDPDLSSSVDLRRNGHHTQNGHYSQSK